MLKIVLCVLSVLLILVSSVLIIFSQKLDMVFKDYFAYSYKPSEQQFPKIIHQTWKDTNLNESQLESQKKLHAIYPDYQYILWTDRDIEEFAAKNFPSFMDTWNKLTPFIKKVDCIRYMWMYKIGGIYYDIDVMCKKSLENIILDKPGNTAFIPTMHSEPTWAENTDASSPAIIASYPGNPFWLMMLDYIKENHTRAVLDATGPVAVANVLRKVHSLPEQNRPNIIILSECRMGLGPFKKIFGTYAYHLNAGTWAS